MLYLSQVRAGFESLLGVDLGRTIESSLFQHHQSAGKAYLAQYRDIMANLKDTKNDLKSVDTTPT